MDLLYSIGILSPSRLLILIPVSILTILLMHYLKRQFKKYEEHGYGSPMYSTRAPLRYLFVAVVIIISLIQPYNGYDEIPLKQHGGDLMFVIDISKSMLANDLQPSRMDAVKRKIIDTINLTQHSGAIARFGLTVYAGDGYTICPVTSDGAVVKQFAEFLSPDLVSSGGSNITAGIETALERLDTNRRTTSSILLMTDGERVAEATETRSLTGDIPLNIIGFGTPTGSSITLPNGTTLRDTRGNVVRSRLEEDYLEELAKQNGGHYARATIDDSDIRRLFTKLSTNFIAEQTTSSMIRVYNELGPIVAAIALLCFSLIRLRAFLPLLLFSVLLPIGPSYTVRADTLSLFSPDKALEQYNNGAYAEAEELYRALLRSDPKNRVAKRGLASTLLKKGELSESQKLFHELAEEQQSGRDFYENTFNEGNVLIAQQNYLAAIEAYNRALDVKPGDEPALHNLKIARQLLEEKKQTPTPQNKTAEEQSSEEQHNRENRTPEPHDQASNQTPSDHTDAQNEPLPSPNESPSSTPSGPSEDRDKNVTESESSAPEHTSNEQAPRLKEAFVSATPCTPESLPQDLAPSTAITESPPLPSPTVQDSIESKYDMSNEVKAWLESLPDSPLLIRRKQSKNRNNHDW